MLGAESLNERGRLVQVVTWHRRKETETILQLRKDDDDSLHSVNNYGNVGTSLIFKWS